MENQPQHLFPGIEVANSNARATGDRSCTVNDALMSEAGDYAAAGQAPGP